LKLVAELSNQYQPQHYVIADSDTMSLDKLYAMEKNRAYRGGNSVVCFCVAFAYRWLKLAKA